MIIWVVLKNGEVVEGRIHATPDQAFDFFVEKFTKEYPHAKIAQVKDELKNLMKENNGFLVQAGEDLWVCSEYIRTSPESDDEEVF